MPFFSPPLRSPESSYPNPQPDLPPLCPRAAAAPCRASASQPTPQPPNPAASHEHSRHRRSCSTFTATSRPCCLHPGRDLGHWFLRSAIFWCAGAHPAHQLDPPVIFGSIKCVNFRAPNCVPLWACCCRFELNCAKQSKFATMDNSADSSVDTSMGACINEDELRLLLDKKAAPVIYVWFVPSPSMDIAQGIMKTIYVNKMVNSGCTVKILIAAWFVQMNYKIGSDLNKIRTVGCYNIEAWKAAGMDLDRVKLIWLSDIMNIHAANFWPLAVDIGQKNTLDGIKRCCKKTTPYGPGLLQATELLLPCLQCATMLFQKEVDIWMLDMDQREVSILARKYCEDIKRENKPVILLYNMLPDLLEYPEVAGVSNPARAISIEDNEDDDIPKHGKYHC